MYMIIREGEKDGFAFVVIVVAAVLMAFRQIAGSLSQEAQKKNCKKKLPRRSEQLCTGGHTTNDGETMIIIDGTHTEIIIQTRRTFCIGIIIIPAYTYKA